PGSEEGTQRRKRITAFSFYPLTAMLQLKFPFTVVVMQAIPGDIIHRIRFLDVACALTDNHGKFHFPIGFLAVARNHQIVVRSYQWRCRLKKDHRLRWNGRSGFARVVRIVEPEAYDLRRSCDRRSKPHFRIYFRECIQIIAYPRTKSCQSVRLEKSFAKIFAEC